MNRSTSRRLVIVATIAALSGGFLGTAPASAAPDDQALLNAARTYFTGENALRVDGAPAAAEAGRARTLAVADGFRRVREDRMTARRQISEVNRLAGVRFSDVRTEITPVGGVTVRESAGSARLGVREHTRYTYADGAQAPYEYTVRHDLTFTRDGATWVLSGIGTADGPAHLATPEKLGPAELARARAEAVALRKSLKKPTSKRSSASGQGATKALGYNYQAMVDFAVKYATAGDNVPYERDENDCTNFVSQALAAGGWKEVPGWYRSDSAWWYNHNWWPIPDNHSWTWGGAPNWQRFARDRSHRVYELDRPGALGLADVVQFEIHGYSKPGEPGHTMMVTSFTGDWMPKMSYHTTDTLNKPLSEIMAAHPNEKFWFFRT
ncbi:amidase domain-containing protein [Streptomyces sp. MST-110588]|uniref:amidase domain-containing protein n=1 Tax=Streptomyces sp. MST-110588 TaxID=2833628 RepID=UPI001F5DC116|nr:amidase domain-containing protein [Streptomyces sp. MST-110588]UNO38518.1 amidase domain-containing protein [Streptomyces sp. MST-110588]